VWDPHARRLHRKTFKVLAEALTWRDDIRTAVRNRAIRPTTKTTVREAAQALLAGMRSGDVLDRSEKSYKPSTIRSYAVAVTKYLEPDPLARMALGDVRHKDVQDYADRLRKKNLSPSTIPNMIYPTASSFAARTSVTRSRSTRPGKVKLPPVRGKRDRVAGRAHAALLIAALPVAERALWATALYAGLRRGELRALRWSDVDLAAKPVVIRVTRARRSTRASKPRRSVLPALLPTASPRHRKGPVMRGLSQYRYGDSNPGFRRERAAS
jgi:integrase